MARLVHAVWFAVLTGCSLLTALDGLTAGSDSMSTTDSGGPSDDGGGPFGGGDGALVPDGDAPSSPSAIVVVGGQRDVPDADIANVESVEVAPVLRDGGLGVWSETTFSATNRFLETFVVGQGPQAFVFTSPSAFVGTVDTALRPTWGVQAGVGRSAFCAVASGDSVFLTGGQTNGFTAEVVGAQAKPPLTWVATSPMPDSRHFHGCAADARFVYVLGGKNAAGEHQSTVFFASRTSTGKVGTWSTTTPLPSIGFGVRGVVIGSRLVVVGGEFDTVDLRSVYHAKINDDGTLGLWQTGVSLPVRRYNYAVGLSGDRIFVLGGGDNGATFGDVYTTTFDAATGAMLPWSQTTSLTTPRRTHGAAIVPVSN